MKVEWYVVDSWNFLYGPYKNKAEALDSIESDFKSGEHEISAEEHFEGHTIFPQLVKESE